MSNIKLRTAHPNDSDFAYNVKKAVFKKYLDLSTGWNDIEQKQLHRQRFESQDFRVIEFMDKDIGIVAIDKKTDYIKLNQLFILPEYQSKGRGSECMLQIMAEANGLPIQLQVIKSNPKAIRFYKKLGFINKAETETHELMQRNP